MSNLMKRVNEIVKRDEDVLQGLAVHAVDLPERMSRFLDHPGVADATRTLLDAAGGKVRRCMKQTQDADHAHLVELSDNDGIGKARLSAADDVYRELVAVRSIVDSVHGAQAVRELGFIGDTPRDPESLGRLGALVITKLDGLPAMAATRRVALDVRGLKADLAATLEPLTAANDAFRRDRKEDEATLRERNNAIDEDDRSALFLKQLLVTFATGLGDADLVERLRRSVTPAARGTKDAGIETEPATEAVG